jgi:hypothetical protein
MFSFSVNVRSGSLSDLQAKSGTNLEILEKLGPWLTLQHP